MYYRVSNMDELNHINPHVTTTGQLLPHNPLPKDKERINHE
jgi:hypothetical protein